MTVSVSMRHNVSKRHKNTMSIKGGAKNNLLKGRAGKRENLLTLQARAFIEAYLSNGGNGTRAYMSAYGEQTDYNTAGAGASRLLKDARVRDEIDMRLHEIATPEWIEREIQKDIITGDKSQRTSALALLARIRSMVSEKRVNVVEQRKEYGEIVLDEYAEGKQRSDKVNVA